MNNNPTEGTVKQMLDPIGKLFGDAWKLYKEKIEVSIKILALPAVAITIGQLMALAGPFLAALGGIISLVGAILLIIASIALISVIGQGTSGKEAWQRGRKLFWPFLWVSALTSMVTLGGFMMLIIPGIMLMVWCLLSTYILVIEDKRGLNTLMQSREYTRGYWWALFGRYLLLILIVGIIFGAISGLFTALLGKAVGAVVYLILELLVVPFTVAYSYTIYHNLTTLKPELATTQATTNRGFLITSVVVGIVAPIILIGLFSSLIFFALTNPSLKEKIKLPENFPGAAPSYENL